VERSGEVGRREERRGVVGCLRKSTQIKLCTRIAPFSSPHVQLCRFFHIHLYPIPSFIHYTFFHVSCVCECQSKRGSEMRERERREESEKREERGEQEREREKRVRDREERERE